MQPTDKFYLSNSMLHDWEQSCPLEWKARWIDKNPLYQFTSDAMERGNVFETLAIGVSVGGKPTQPSEALKKSVYYERIQIQAKCARQYLTDFGGKVLARQEYLYGAVSDSQGRTLCICGNLDIRYGWPNERNRRAVIDLKFTADTENTYGKFAWGNPQSMDLSQAKQYTLLHKLNWPDLPYPEFYYFVLDHEKGMKKSIIKVNITEAAIQAHIDRLSKAYFEITDSIDFGFTAKNTFANCSQCKCPCEYERKFPDIIEIEI